MCIRLVGMILFGMVGWGYLVAQTEYEGLEIRQGSEYVLEQNEADHPCITQAEYDLLEKNCARNAALAGWSFSEEQELITQLEWPLRPGNELKDCSYYMISAFVDQDNTSGQIKDYQCGSRTYDGHRGTDIAMFPYRFIKMNNNLVEVVAAAAGTILDKADGNTDKNCGSTSLLANYIVIGHPDGSRALYFHMKKNSVTVKTIGETVEAGEYLGVVGSSGNSSGPHLHFEVWSGSTVGTRIDPFSGTCNSLNSTTWWKNQKPYSEPAVVKVSTNSADVVIPPCPETESPNEKACFPVPYQGVGLPAGFAKFYMFIRQETAGLTANLRILNPDSTIFLSWTHVSSNSYNSSWWGFSKKLPVKAGRYTFDVLYNGMTCSSEFEILDAMIEVNGPTSICPGDSVLLSANEGHSYLWTNGQTTQNIYAHNKGTYQVTIQGEFGCSSISPEIELNEYPQLNGLAIEVMGDTLVSPYSDHVYWYLDGLPEPVDSGKVIHCLTDGLYISEGLDEHGCHVTSLPINVICPMTSIADPLKDQFIQILPNPTTGWLHVIVNQEWDGPVEITIQDITGKPLVQRLMSEKERKKTADFNLENAPNGVYILTVQGPSWKKEKLVIKQ